jgi:hypothetical protein
MASLGNQGDSSLIFANLTDQRTIGQFENAKKGSRSPEKVETLPSIVEEFELTSK